jgi:hypothetical protein
VAVPVARPPRSRRRRIHLQEGRWLPLAVHAEKERGRIEPFADIEIDLAPWWLDDGGATTA